MDPERDDLAAQLAVVLEILGRGVCAYMGADENAVDYKGKEQWEEFTKDYDIPDRAARLLKAEAEVERRRSAAAPAGEDG